MAGSFSLGRYNSPDGVGSTYGPDRIVIAIQPLRTQLRTARIQDMIDELEFSVPLFFFDIDDGVLVRDEHGMECRDLGHMRELAKRLLPEIVLDELPRLPDDEKCFFVTVRNQDDIVVYRASLNFKGEPIEI